MVSIRFAFMVSVWSGVICVCLLMVLLCFCLMVLFMFLLWFCLCFCYGFVMVFVNGFQPWAVEDLGNSMFFCGFAKNHRKPMVFMVF